MSIVIVFLCIALLIILISQFKINAFLAFLVVSILAGLMLGIDTTKIVGSVQKGVGDMLGGLVIVIVSGAMLGKLVADSGAAQQIASSMMRLFGERYIQWALMITGFVIGIPLFYNVGFVLVIPLIFSVTYRYKLPAVYIGLPMLAALSVTHGFLPPHPAPTTLVGLFGANMGKTLLYGFIVAVPTVIIAGPLFAKTLRGIHAPLLKTFQSAELPADKLPSLANSIISSLLPVILLAVTTIALQYMPAPAPLQQTKTELAPMPKADSVHIQEVDSVQAAKVDSTIIPGADPTPQPDPVRKALMFISDPAIVMLISLVIATFTLGINMKTSMKKIMDIYGESVKDIALLLLIVGGAGALKQVLIDSGVSDEIGVALKSLDVHPLVLGWAIACVIRVCVGSATVAGLTAAGIIKPLVNQPGVDPSLMVLSIGAGSLMFSHVNDAGFWLFKEYFNLSIKDTIRSWSLMETVVAVVGLIGVMILNIFVSAV